MTQSAIWSAQAGPAYAGAASRRQGLRFASAKLVLRRINGELVQRRAGWHTIKRERWLPHSIKILSRKQDFKY